MKYIILAAGSGTRLWPLSRPQFPKQFLHFGDGESLLQKTVKRFYPAVPAKEILVVTHQDYFHLVKGQLSAIHPDLTHQILLEPEKRGTAPAICLAMKYCQEKLGTGAEETYLVSPSDLILSPATPFLEAVEEAKEYAKQGHHILFGVHPHRPETGYGYIKKGAPYKGSAHKVARFVEKPNQPVAEQFLLSGEYLWNTGIFLFSSSLFFEEMASFCPLSSFRDLHEQFSTLPHLSIDYALMEKSEKCLVFPLSLSWSDVGSWDSVYELLDKDERANAKVGNVVDLHSKNCLIMGGERLISTVGLEDLLIIETKDALLIGKRGESQHVRALFETLKRSHPKESSEHLTSHRPWGSFSILEEGERYKIKRIVVKVGEQLSLQLHHHRSEHWVVVKGTAKVLLGEREHLVHENESIYVEKSQPHRLCNIGKMPLEVIEVQVGEYVEEDDIVRLEDCYERAK